jgi:hypothetical protein
VARLRLAVALPVAAQGHDRAAVLKLNQALQWLCCHLQANQILVAKLRIDRRMARAPVTRRPPSRQARLRRHRMDKKNGATNACVQFMAGLTRYLWCSVFGTSAACIVVPSEAWRSCGEWPSNERWPDSFRESANFPGNPVPSTLS